MVVDIYDQKSIKLNCEQITFMKKILFFLLIFIHFNTSLQSNTDLSLNLLKPHCDKKTNLQTFDLKKIEKIEIDVNNYKKWTVNGTRIITTGTRFIPKKYKKRFKSKLSVTYEGNIKCFLTAEIRHSGDAKDHVKLLGNNILQSLDVHLKTGNIKGITKFKLYLPEVRGVLEDEIIQTEILRELNYLAPRSYKVMVRVNQAQSIMLFQEKSAKELLEYNHRREGPILEGDQKFFFKLVEDIPDNQLSNWSVGTPALRSKSIKAMLSKQSNSQIIHKSANHKKISYNALNDLNLIYLYYANRFQDKKNNFNFFNYDLDNSLLALFNPKKIIKLEIYNLLMQSTNSQHGLTPNNRKFYWNSLENYFEPINYDSNPYIDGLMPTTTTASFRYPVSEHFTDAIKELELKLENLDFIKINKNLELAGLNINGQFLNKKIKKIKSNLKVIKKNYSQINKIMVEHNKYRPINNILKKFNKTLIDIDPTVVLVRNQDQTEDLKVCKIYLENCETLTFSKQHLSSLLEGELILDNITYQYLGKDLNLNNLNKNNITNLINLEDSEIFYEDGIKININDDTKLIEIYQTKEEARIFIVNGLIEDYTINFNGLNKNNLLKKFPINLNNLTGCLTFLNIELKNVSINANNSSCEDAVNLINVKGDIKNITISDSIMDGLDIDFSNLKITNIDIKNSKNDCLDLSFGKYKILKTSLKKCGDKALSVGEKSILDLDKIIAEDSDTGIASKDGSISNLTDAYFNNLKTCVSAYRKKQEFDGGLLNIINLSCKNYFTKTNVDKFSKILIKNEL